jgi:hypothetical protein
MKSTFLFAPALVAIALALGPAPTVPAVAAGPAPAGVVALTVEGGQVVLSHPRFGRLLPVTASGPTGDSADVTDQVAWESADPKVAEFDAAAGRVVPRGNGRTTLTGRYGGATVTVPVAVSNFAADPPVSMALEIVPVLTKAGCNAGACHGSQYGKGGLKLSLFGSDPDADYVVLTRAGGSRRIDRVNPAAGLILAKPTMSVPHEGGLRFEVGSREYELLARWIRSGVPAEDSRRAARVTALAVYPAQREFRTLGVKQRLLALATFSDGSVRDVTRDARFDSNQPGAATVAADGTVSVVGRGEAAIMVRYMGAAAVGRVVVVRDDEAYAWPDPPAHNFIDEHVYAKLRRMKYVPSPLCTDEEFIRRACLDATGSLPRLEEVTAFLADPTPSRQKRARYIDDLLKRQEFVNYWTLKWGDWLRNSGDQQRQKPMLALHQWIKAGLRDAKPLDRMVVELVTARGSTFRNGPANFYRLNRGAPEIAETVAQTFLGIRLQCAKCHQHPFERWTQDDYYGLAAYFARIGNKADPEYGLFGGAQDVVVNPTGEVTNPRTGRVMPPTPLGAGKPRDDPTDRRRALAAWMTDRNNLALARNFVNRFWAMLMGRGLVEPVDDLRDTNPPTHPELFDALARDLIARDYDLRHLLRTIMNSRTYQLSSAPVPGNAEDTQCYSRYYVKRLTAEQLLDAVCSATGVLEKFPLLPLGTRAIDLPDPETPSYFLDIFGRPKREITCECERQGDPNMSQALHLINGDLLNGKVTGPSGRVAALLKTAKTDEQIIEELYLVALARRPKPAELDTARKLIKQAPSRKEGVEDLLWTLCNCKEFLFNR